MGKVPPRRKSVPNLGPKAPKAEKPKGKPAADKPIKVPFDLINFDTDTQSRTGIDQGVVDDYAESIASMPPVTLFADGSGRYWIGDGWHRIAAASKAKAKAVLAVVKLGGKDEAIEHACGANDKHGLRRTRADVRRSISLMLIQLAHKNYSGREIARRVRCDNKTVEAVRAELEASEEIPHSDDGKRTSIRDGKEVQVDISANQRKSDPSVDSPTETADIAESLPVSGAETVDLDEPFEEPSDATAAADPDGQGLVEERTDGEVGEGDEPVHPDQDAVPEEAPAEAPASLPEGIPADAVVEDPGETTRPEPQDDAAWLESLPARAALVGKKRASFDLDALLWRRIAEARRDFITIADKAVKAIEREAKKAGLDPVGYTSGLIWWFKRRSHPSEWIVCPACKGTGDWHNEARKILTPCSNCGGRGYRPKDAGPRGGES